MSGCLQNRACTHPECGLVTLHEYGLRCVGQDPICLWPNVKVRYKKICILFRHLHSESDSVFRLAPLCLVVSRGVLTALVFVLLPDSLMMSGACLQSSSVSKYSTPTPNTRFNNRRLFTFESSNPSDPTSFSVYLDLRRLSMCLSPTVVQLRDTKKNKELKKWSVEEHTGRLK